MSEIELLAKGGVAVFAVGVLLLVYRVAREAVKEAWTVAKPFFAAVPTKLDELKDAINEAAAQAEEKAAERHEAVMTGLNRLEAYEYDDELTPVGGIPRRRNGNGQRRK